MKYGALLVLFGYMQIAYGQSPDTMVIRQVDSLIQVSRDLTAKKIFDQALESNAKAESIALEVFGRESATYGRCAFNRGRVHYFSKNFPEAEAWYLTALNIRSIALGKDHIAYVQNLNTLATLCHELGRYEEAEAYYLEALSIYERIAGKENPEYAGYLYNLAILYRKTGQFESAEPLLLESRNLWIALNDIEHPQYDYTVNELAHLYRNMQHYEKAENYYLESQKIRKKIYGADHPELAKNLNSLAKMYVELGFYEKAETLFIESKNIRMNTLGTAHPLYASGLNNLGYLYHEMGQFEKAEIYYRQANEIWGKALGTEDLGYAGSLHNLGLFYKDIGNYIEAEHFLTEALSIREKRAGTDHPEYAQSIEGLAILYYKTGQYRMSESYFLQARDILASTHGVDSREYADLLNNLANLYLEMEQNLQAEKIYLESQSIREKIFGHKHHMYANSMHNLANLYRLTGHFDKAEPLLLESQAIFETSLGVGHPYYLEGLNSLANLYEIRNQNAKSPPLLKEYSEQIQSRLSNSFSYLSARELAGYTVTFQGVADKIANYLKSRAEKNEQVDILPALLFNHTLFEKGFLLQAATRLQNLAQSSPEAININNELKGYRRRIAAVLSQPITDRMGLQDLEAKANALEKELVRAVAGYSEEMKQVKWQEVQEVLGRDAIALEFVHFEVNFPTDTDSVLYAVLLLRPRKYGDEQPLFIPLFEARTLDHLLDIKMDRKSDYVNELYAWSERGMVKLGSEKPSLYDLIWKKIEATGLEGIKTIYYAPSGVLHRLNLGAIAIDDESNLSDQYNLVTLNSTRQLVIPTAIAPFINDAVIIGGVNFESDTVFSKVDSLQWLTSRSTVSSWSESGSRGENWTYLKWTEKEAERIAATLEFAQFNTIVYKGINASEEAIKAIGKEGHSPRVLHIATHGFFYPDSEQNLTSNMSGEPVFKWSDNPMIRSGLILAGGNYAWQNGRAPRPDMEDGILTAYEISQMNLSNTELVVLSACETGLGDIQGNEGVYGLQRAFKIAGAKYLIMSLWQVPDRETMEFMTTFYKNWLEGKMTIPDAFRKTQREMRDRFFNPYSWAGFILVE